MPTFYASQRTTRYFAIPSLLVLLTSLAGCATGGTPLNSQLIEAHFGSYGVEVLSDDGRRRVSSLYSLDDGVPITRTYAVVDYLATPGPELAREREAITAGASIGSTFRNAGWSIRKQTVFVGELELSPSYAAIGEHMQIGLPARVAVHQYLFIVSRDDRSSSFARITEIHHPDFLSVQEVEQLYGEVVFDDSNRDSLHDFIGPPTGN